MHRRPLALSGVLSPGLCRVHVWLANVFVALIVLFGHGPSGAAEPLTLHLAIAEDSGVYRALALELDTRLSAKGLRLVLVETRHSEGPLPASPLWLAAGPDALERLFREQPGTPVLSLLNTREFYEALVQSYRPGPYHSAIYQDPPPLRQIQLLHVLLPEAKRIGVLHSPEYAEPLHALQAQAATLGVTLTPVALSGNQAMLPPLLSLLNSNDALLALADSKLINRRSLKMLLLTSYRARKPVLGNSEAMVAAGALASSYASIAHIADQAERVVQQALRVTPVTLPAPAYAESFSIRVNSHVARSLGLRLPEPVQLEQQLRAVQDSSATSSAP